jgi:hypothetical protein
VRLLTRDQLLEIKEIIRRHHAAVIVSVAGATALSEADKHLLVSAGIQPEELGTIEESYLFGRVLAMRPKASKLSYPDFKSLLEKNPVPLTEHEEAAVNAARHSAGTHIQNLGMRIDSDVTQSILEQDASLRAERIDSVREHVAEAIAKREGIQALRKRLGDSVGSWNRDWIRVAVTERAQAMNQGSADVIQDQHGAESYVFKRPQPGACEHCLALFLGPDGHPRIFKLSELTAHGHNHGRKAKDWLPTIAPVHPHCRCTLERVPPGWGFDESGDLVPGGTGGRRYESAEEIELALTGEAELQKAGRVRGRLNYRGLPIAIENPAGSVRKWRGGETTMLVPYGYVEGTLGADGDEYDAYVGPDPLAEFVYVIDQADGDGGFDEQKAIVGASDIHQARAIYLAHRDDGEAALQSMAILPFEEFRAKVLGTGKPGLMQDGLVKSPSNGAGYLKDRVFFLPEGLDPEAPLQKALNAEHAADGSQWGNRSVRGTPNLGFGYGRTAGESARTKADVAFPVEELAEPYPLLYVPIKDPTIYEPGERERQVRPVEVPDGWAEAQQSVRDEAGHNAFVLVETAKRRAKGRITNYADVEAEEVQKAEKGEQVSGHKYTEREWMVDHWAYTYAAERGGKIEGHAIDLDAVILKLPKAKLAELKAFAQKHHLAHEPFEGGKYAMVQLSQSEAHQLRQLAQAKKPAVVQQAEVQKPATKKQDFWKGEPVDQKDLSLPATKLLQAGQGVTATIGGKAVSGQLEGWDYQGRAVIRAEGQRRIAKFSDVKPSGDKQPQKRSYDKLQKGQIVRATERHQKLVNEIVAEEVLPGRQASAYLGWLHQRGIEAYLVGGVVRDLIAGTSSGLTDDEVKEKMRDVDIVAAAPPMVGVKMFAEHPVAGGKSYNQAGGVWSDAGKWGMVLAGGAKGGFGNREEGLDYASMLSAGAFQPVIQNQDAPAEPDVAPLDFDHDIQKDARRRDFSVNSLYYDPHNHAILDPTGYGIEDAQKKHLRVIAGDKELVGNHNISFRFWKFRIRGYTSDKENIQKMRDSFAHFAAHGNDWMSAEKLIITEAVKACGKVCKTPQDFLTNLRKVMTEDGCADLYDKHVFPLEDQIKAVAKKEATKLLLHGSA